MKRTSDLAGLEVPETFVVVVELVVWGGSVGYDV